MYVFLLILKFEYVTLFFLSRPMYIITFRYLLQRTDVFHPNLIVTYVLQFVIALFSWSPQFLRLHQSSDERFFSSHYTFKCHLSFLMSISLYDMNKVQCLFYHPWYYFHLNRYSTCLSWVYIGCKMSLDNFLLLF